MTRARTLLVAVAALLLLPATLRAEPPANWDQARVTSIARNLANAAKELKTALSKNPAPSIPLARERLQYELQEDIRLLANSTNHLATRLEAGASRDETAPIVKRIGVLRRDAEENGRRMQIDEPTFAKVTATGDLLNQLAPYYAEPE